MTDKKSKPYAFAANTQSVNEVYNNSLFKGLFKERNTLLLEKVFPKVEKGLALPELSQKVGGATYTFKLNDVADKVSIKDKEKEITCRYKKDTKKFDFSLKTKAADNMDVLMKYEEKQQGAPHYVGGVTYSLNNFMGFKKVDIDVKYNPFTGFAKGSTLLDLVDLGLKAAADCKVNLNDPKPIFNAGLVHNHATFGVTNVSYNHENQFVTCSHFVQVDKSLSACGEYVLALAGGNPKCPLAAGVGYKLDKDHTLKCRVNSHMGLQVLLEKNFMPGFSVLFGTAYDLGNPGAMLGQMPSFGIKVVSK